MGRKRKVPLSYKARPWFKGDITTDSEDGENYVPQPIFQWLEMIETLSDVPSEPLSPGSPESFLFSFFNS